MKKSPKTDAIFNQLRKVNREADETEGDPRLHMDAKASVKLGFFSRCGHSRVEAEAADHAVGDKGSLTPFSILSPQNDDLPISFAESKITNDYLWDRVECHWAEWQAKYSPSTLAINQDNGPENKSRRTPFIKRTMGFAKEYGMTIGLAYYPPYHSKYNPAERTHRTVEQYLNKYIMNVESNIKIIKNMT